MRYAMIMAGGKGTRLWPMSREGRPKQLIDFINRDGRSVSLLHLAAERLGALVPQERRYLCTGEGYRSAIREKLPQFTDERILGEPEGRDTLNAVGFGAAVFEKLDANAVFAVLTADQLIEPEGVFAEAVDIGFKLVERDPTRLVTFGITPTFPATGYGYIERSTGMEGTGGLGFEVARFVEKPDLARAQAYVQSGDFLWNAGMFVFHAGTFMKLLGKYKPESHAGLRKIQAAWGTGEQSATIASEYPKLPKISVDYAVMEPASVDPAVSIVGVEMKTRWLDVGSWPTFAETVPADGQGNRASGSSRAMWHDARGNVVVGDRPGHTVALLGVENLVVVTTDEATLVMPMERAQDLKLLHGKLPEELK